MLLALLVDLDMRMSVHQRGAGGQHRCVIDAVVRAGAKHMAMRAKELATVAIHHESAVGHTGKLEHHLIDFCFTVAAHRNHAPALGKIVEQRNHALGSVIAREVVAGPMVEQVAQKNDAIGLFGLDSSHQALGPIRGAMDIGCDKKLHDGSNLKTSCNE